MAEVKAAVDVKGLRKFNKLLAEAPEELQEEMKAANKRIADLIADRAQVRAPIKTGKLRKSIRASSTFRMGSVKAGSKKVPYAKPIHFGWKSRGIPPRKFMYQALDDSADEALDMYLKAVNEIIEKLSDVKGED